jgi:hypothetical protein
MNNERKKFRLTDFFPCFGFQEYVDRNQDVSNTEIDSGAEIGIYTRYLAITLYNYAWIGLGYGAIKGIEAIVK